MELDELQSNFKELGCINEKQEDKVRFYETRAHHLIMVYIIFQGGILISVSLLSASNQCKRWWLPSTISLLSSIIFFMAFIDAVITFYYTQYHLDLNYLEREIIYKQIHEAKSTHCSTKSGESSSTEKRPYHEIIKPDVVQLFKRKVYIFLTTLVLIAFTVIMLFASRSLLCSDSSDSVVTTSTTANSQSSSSP